MELMFVTIGTYLMPLFLLYDLSFNASKLDC